jgi:nicotinic acid phosphoribosyltransferase
LVRLDSGSPNKKSHRIVAPIAAHGFRDRELAVFLYDGRFGPRAA